MTIRLIFSINRETFFIDIKDKIVRYNDRMLKNDLQVIPPDPEYKKRVIMSRNKIPQYIINLVQDANSGKNIEEYNSAKNDEELVPIIKWDCASRGCKFEKRLELDDEPVDELDDTGAEE